MKAEITLTDDDGAVYRHVAEMPAAPIAARSWDAWVAAACAVTNSAVKALHDSTGVADHVKRARRRRDRAESNRLARIFDEPQRTDGTAAAQN